jgi:hypothetical protein
VVSAKTYFGERMNEFASRVASVLYEAGIRDDGYGDLVKLMREARNIRDSEMTNERKNITQPADWWVAFEAAAEAEGVSLAAWLGEAAKAKLPPKVAKKLTERPPANRPPKAKD